MNQNSGVIIIAEVGGRHMLATFLILRDRLIIPVRVESLVGNIVIGWSVLHLAID